MSRTLKALASGLFTAGMALTVSPAIAAPSALSQTPLFVSEAVAPFNMLVVGRDHKLFFPAYNDASDLDGDGVLDIYYKPSITYLGYFDSYTCYTHANDVFTPATKTTDKTCTGLNQWSGDYLNYLTTSRIDALRKVLYGGYRYTDSKTSTVLERTAIPNDAHSWGKEYKSIARDGYDISKYTPLAKPSATGNNYILFANTSIGGKPKLRVITALQNAGNFRIWGWVSRESSQGTNNITNINYGNSIIIPAYDMTVRVEVCKGALREENCAQYKDNTYKPTGLLHDYGAVGKMNFGLMTGTYSNNTRGGVLRKAPAPFNNEFDEFGRFKVESAYANTAGIVYNLDKFTHDGSCDATNTTPLPNGRCAGWGNPIGEIAYEALRYFKGDESRFDAYGAGSKDSGLGLSSIGTWTNPYTNYPVCTKPFNTLISDVNPSYDSDLPTSVNVGSTSDAIPGETKTLPNFDFSTLGATLWQKEGLPRNANINIGESSGTENDSAPTAKSASSFATIRGLPEEPSRQGSYSSSAVAYYGSQNKVTSTGSHPVQTFSIALSTTLPRIEMTTSKGTARLVPFGTVTGSNNTEQLTGFYVDTQANMPGQTKNTAINGGRPYIQFRVVYDDAAQGGDYDMDAIVLYTVQALANGDISVTSDTEYSVAGFESHMGYTIAGTTKDGVYLEVTGGGNGNARHALDTPPGKWAGECAVSNANCALLPGRKNSSATLGGGRDTKQTRTFTPSSKTSVTTLENPLWYAAKYGLEDLTTWDTNGDGQPDNYFLVSNPSQLRNQLDTAFNKILQLNNSVTAVAVDVDATQNSTEDDALIYRTSFDINGWGGNLYKERRIKTTGEDGTVVTTTESLWNADSVLKGRSTERKIFYAKAGKLVDLQWGNNTDTTLAGYLNKNSSGVTDSQGQARVNFLKGSLTAFRTRTSKLGDIVNSSPILVKGAEYLTTRADQLEGSSNYGEFKAAQEEQPEVVYIGSNDGMLHAFNANNGNELFAFIPTATWPNLSTLTDPLYGTEQGPEHQPFVDATVTVKDVYFKSSSSWHKVLIGGLGAGGRSIFALDVTDPTKPSLLWEFGSTNDSDMGFSVGTTTIGRLRTGEWAAIVPNGYASSSASSGKVALFLLDIESGRLIRKLEATPALAENETLDALGNGLSSPTAVDLNADAIIDYVYAGDLLGNMWRFDLLNSGVENALTASANADQYKVAFSGKPLYTAYATNSTRQAITAAPTVINHPSNQGRIISFGTGRYQTLSDKSSTQTQSIYGIWDTQTAGEGASSAPTTDKSRSDLQSQQFTQVTYNGNTAYTLSSDAITWYSSTEPSGKFGWYVDLPKSGERMVYDMTLYGKTLAFSTITPVSDPCSPGLRGSVYGVNPLIGGATAYNVFDMNGDGVIDEKDGTSDGDAISGFDSSDTGAGDFSIRDESVYSSDGSERGINSGAASQRQTWQIVLPEEDE